MSIHEYMNIMTTEHKIIRFPENLFLKVLIAKSGRTNKHLASKLGVSTKILSSTINGHYKGINIKPALLKELGIDQEPDVQPEVQTNHKLSNI